MATQKWAQPINHRSTNVVHIDSPADDRSSERLSQFIYYHKNRGVRLYGRRQPQPRPPLAVLATPYRCCVKTRITDDEYPTKTRQQKAFQLRPLANVSSLVGSPSQTNSSALVHKTIMDSASRDSVHEDSDDSGLDDEAVTSTHITMTSLNTAAHQTFLTSPVRCVGFLADVSTKQDVIDRYLYGNEALLPGKTSDKIIDTKRYDHFARNGILPPIQATKSQNRDSDIIPTTSSSNTTNQQTKDVKKSKSFCVYQIVQKKSFFEPVPTNDKKRMMFSCARTSVGDKSYPVFSSRVSGPVRKVGGKFKSRKKLYK